MTLEAEVTTKPNGATHTTAGFFDPSGGLEDENLAVEATAIVAGPEEQRTSTPILADARYPSPDIVSRQFGTALRLLRETGEQLGRARDAMANSDLVGADDASCAIQRILPELFCCRSIGEGFAEVIAGLFSSFQNLAGQPLNPDQLEAVGASITALRREPRISVILADRLLGTLEDVGLEPDPAGLEDLVQAVSPSV